MKKIVLALALLLATASCDFLDVVPEGSPTQDDIYKTQAQAEKMLFMIYGKCPDLFHAQAMPDLNGGDDLISSYYGSVRYFSWKSLAGVPDQHLLQPVGNDHGPADGLLLVQSLRGPALRL